MCELKSQFDFFNQHKSDYIENHLGEFVVISKVLDTDWFKTRKEAYIHGASKYGLGNFLIQECTYDAVEKIEVVMPIIEIA